jgi:hypothetical protein
MAKSPLRPDIDETISALFRRFVAYTRARSPQERALLESQILALFDSLGASDDTSIREARAAFEGIRISPDASSKRVSSVADRARDFATERIRTFERRPSNPKLSKAARDMLRIPLAEVSARTGAFDAEQAGISLDLILSSLREAPTSGIEGDRQGRTSIAVIRGFVENFCNIPPFCSGKPR